MGRIEHYNTLSRRDVTASAHWASKIVKVLGGFVAYESKQDVPKKIVREMNERTYPYKYEHGVERKKPYDGRNASIIEAQKLFTLSKTNKGKANV